MADNLNKYKQYANDVLSGKVVACKYIQLACQRYLSFFSRDDLEFKADKADRVINFISKLKHFTGAHNGKPFILQPWQSFIIYNVYGFYYQGTNERVTKNVYIEVARKNGKTAFAAALCLYALVADGESNAEVELIANSRKQASICFDMSSNFVESINFKNKLFKCYRDKIKFDKTKSFLQVLSSDVSANDGWNSYLFVADEAHSYKDSKMYDVMKSSQGMRNNPLAIVITTAGFNQFSFCYEMRKTNIEILHGLKQDDTQFTAIYTLDDTDDFEDEKVWVKSNPNLNVTVKPNYLKEQVIQAKNNTSLETSIRTKNFNQWLSTSQTWIPNNLLLQHSKKINLNDFNGLSCYMGVDLSAVSDLTAVSALIDTDGLYYFKTFYFLPASALKDNVNSELYKKWYNNKELIITAGNVVDYDYILNKILEINNTLIINKIAYDSWNATQWAIDATAAGLPLEPYSQALWNFNRPTKEFERLIKSGKVIIDDNEITRYCFQNCVIKTDHNDNSKPVKEQRDNKIDGVISMLEALGILLQTPQYNNQIMAV